MRFRIFGKLGFLVASPFLVTVGLLTLVLGGALGGGHWLPMPQKNMTLHQSGFIAVQNPYRETSRQLLRDVTDLKRETRSLITADGYVMLQLADNTRVIRFMPRPDPFAAIALPTQKGTFHDAEVQLSESMAVEVVLPENADTLSEMAEDGVQAVSVNQATSGESANDTVPAKVASVAMEPVPRKQPM